MSCFEWCPPEQQPGILSGLERNFHGLHQTLTDYFYEKLRRKRIPLAKMAVVSADQNEKFNFCAFRLLTSSMASQLRSRLGTDFTIQNPDGDLVICLCLPDSPQLVVLIFAILEIGGTCLPVDPTYPTSVIFQIIKTFRPILIIHNKPQSDSDIAARHFLTLQSLWTDVLNEFPEGKVPQIVSREIILLRKPSPVLPLPEDNRPGSERPAFIFHTTGLHNVPHGVRISHYSIMNRIYWTWKQVPYPKGGNSSLTVPVTFIECVHQIFGPLLAGITLHIYDPMVTSNMTVFIGKLHRDKITRISLSSVELGNFINECKILGPRVARRKLKYLKFVSCKGEVISIDLARRFFEIFYGNGKSLATMYGYTELTGDVLVEIFKSMDDVAKRYVAGHLVLTKAIVNTKVYIMNVNHDLAVNLEQGQVCVSGAALAMGYVGRKAVGFIRNPFDMTRKYHRLFLTGDYARFVICGSDRQYRLLLEGRGDSFVRYHGYEFLVDDVKDVLKCHVAVEHVNMFIFHQGKADQTVLAFVLPKPGSIRVLTNEVLFNYLKEKIPAFMIPTVIVVESYPVLCTGRLDRHQLIQRYLESRDSGYNAWDQLTLKNIDTMDAARVLLEGMYKFCSIPVDLSIRYLNTSFYAVGGTSLNTISLVLHLQEKGYPISIQDFIGSETLEDLIELMNERKKHRKWSSISPVHQFRDKGTISLGMDTNASQLYTTKRMDIKHQRDAIQIISTACAHFGDVERIAMVTADQLSTFLNMIWDKLVEQQLCFVIIRNSDSKVVGASLCYDFYTDLDIDEAIGPLKYALEFGHEVKGQVMARLNENESANEIYECFLLGTGGLKPSENVRVTLFIIQEMLRQAQSDGFKAVFIASSNQLIRDLLLEIFEFELIDDFVLNEYTDGEIRPFHLAPGNLTMTSFFKVIRTNLQSVSSRTILKQK